MRWAAEGGPWATFDDVSVCLLEPREVDPAFAVHLIPGANRA
jgi:hypothetical protein